MDPDRNKKRRELRARALTQRVLTLKQEGARVYFTDASLQADTNTGTIAYHSEHHEHALQYTNPPAIDDLEEHAIAIAIEHACTEPYTHHPTFIFSDSQDALRSYLQNKVNVYTRNYLAPILHQHPYHHFRLVWVPGHVSMEGNAKANALTRVPVPGPSIGWSSPYSPKTQRALDKHNRRTLLQEYRRNRQTLPPPPAHFSRADAALIRQAQTHSLPSHHVLHKIHRRPSHPHCQCCDTYPWPSHTYWACPLYPPHPPLPPEITSWEAV